MPVTSPVVTELVDAVSSSVGVSTTGVSITQPFCVIFVVAFTLVADVMVLPVFWVMVPATTSPAAFMAVVAPLWVIVFAVTPPVVVVIVPPVWMRSASAVPAPSFTARDAPVTSLATVDELPLRVTAPVAEIASSILMSASPALIVTLPSESPLTVP